MNIPRPTESRAALETHDSHSDTLTLYRIWIPWSANRHKSSEPAPTHSALTTSQ
ncbi:hypothetical protein E2C01_074589 [Portunus trituberculatus]|uniref:Uncharacterized protein n=1 Tax=Portunus trituberculatus TaxID=210409 RepID=A0A5B7IDJ5_PORTR|nr:hypothetical protein [Portunus trituberculatus]